MVLVLHDAVVLVVVVVVVLHVVVVLVVVVVLHAVDVGDTAASGRAFCRSIIKDSVFSCCRLCCRTMASGQERGVNISVPARILLGLASSPYVTSTVSPSVCLSVRRGSHTSHH